MGFMVFHRDCFHEYVPLLCGKEDEMSESVSHFKLSKKKEMAVMALSGSRFK